MRAARAAGLPIGPGKVLAAVEAVSAVALDNRDDFYWTLLLPSSSTAATSRSCSTRRSTFSGRNPLPLERMLGMMLPEITVPDQEKGEEISRRLAEALKKPGDGDSKDQERRDRARRGHDLL